MTSIRVIHAPISPSPQKKQKMEEFMSTLPEIIETEQEIQESIKELKRNPTYECLNTKSDIRKIISRIRRKIPKRDDN
jgi:tellurite resistance protein